MSVLRAFLTPTYLPVLISAIVVGITFLHLLLCSRVSSAGQFQLIRVVWFLIVFLIGPIAVGLLYDSRLLAGESGRGRLAFMLLSFWFGLMCSVYAAFGLFAWIFPARWGYIIQRREQRRAGKSAAERRF